MPDLSHDQIILIKRSWRLFQQINPTLVGGLFYDKLFTDDPPLRRMFNVSLDEQAAKFVNMLTALVSHLDRLHEFSDRLTDLAVRHQAYGVKPRHYAVVGKALLWTLEQGLGIDWTDALKEAWTACYATLATAMMNAAQPAPATPPSKE